MYPYLLLPLFVCVCFFLLYGLTNNKNPLANPIRRLSTIVPTFCCQSSTIPHCITRFLKHFVCSGSDFLFILFSVCQPTFVLVSFVTIRLNRSPCFSLISFLTFRVSVYYFCESVLWRVCAVSVTFSFSFLFVPACTRTGLWVSVLEKSK